MTKYDVEDKINHITNLWGNGAGSIKPGLEGKGCYTQKEKVYFEYFKRMLNFKGGTVLEVGPGTGNFALMLMRSFSIKEYTILDLKKNMGDSMRLLQENNLSGTFIESKNYKQTFNKSYDLFVSNMCLSEVPNYYREDIFNNVLPNCKNVFIIDGDVDQITYNNWLKESIAKYFKVINIVDKPTAISRGCFAIAGS
jgi:phospholipid N-methyltransferase